MMIKSWVIPKIKGPLPGSPFQPANAAIPPISAVNTRCELELYLADTPIHVYIDTCSLLHENTMELLEAVEQTFSRHYQTLYVFDSVYNEMQSVMQRDYKLHRIAKAVERRLFDMQRKGIVCFIKGGSDTFSDVNFISRFVSEISDTNILLISQDHQLTNLALSLKNTLYPCIHSRYNVYAAKLTKDGLTNIPKNYFGR